MKAISLGKNLLLITTFILSSLSLSAFSQEAELLKDRCATRLSISILGKSALPKLLESNDPQSMIDTLLEDRRFIERFSRFINSEFNDEPGQNRLQDAPYFVVRHVLTNKLPYKNIFIGPYNISVPEGNNNVVVQDDPAGLGFFRIKAWMDRYAGNETDGYRLVAAYRMLNNVLGTHMIATTNAPNTDLSATGREAAGCRGCHYDAWFALDKIASVLSKVQRDEDMNITYIDPDNTPKEVLGEFFVKNDKELIETMVNSDEFAFNSCRLSFKFLYGRSENKSEAALFEQCMQSFKSSELIQDALATIAKDKNFCQ